jgi:hypothetical protein
VFSFRAVKILSGQISLQTDFCLLEVAGRLSSHA